MNYAKHFQIEARAGHDCLCSVTLADPELNGNLTPSTPMKPASPFRLIAAAMLLAVLALAGPVSAATITWTNSAGGDWTAVTNWTPNAVPGAGDTAVISGSDTYRIKVIGSVSVDSLVMGNPNASLNLATDATGSQAFLTVAKGFENHGTIELRTGLNGSLVRLTVSTGTLTNAVGGVIRAIEDTVGTRQLFANLDNRGTVQVEGDLFLSGNVANSGTVNIPAGKTLTANNVITWTHRQGAITGTGTLSLASGSTLALEEDFTPGGFVLNAPSLTINGPAKLLGPATGEFLIRDWTINAPMVVSGDVRITGSVSISSALSVAQGKTLRLLTDQTGSQAFLTVAKGFENHGTIELRTGLNGSLVRLTVSTGTLTNAVGGVIRAIEDTVGTRQLFANLDNRGTVQVEGDLLLSGNVANSASGILSGTGTFNFSSATVINDGTVAPGVSPGILSVSGNLPWNPGALFDVEIRGFTAGTDYDRLVLSSPVSFNGTVRAGLINGFFPKKDDAFTVLTYPSRTGSFTTLDNPLPDRIAWEVQYGPTSAQLVVLNTAPTLAAIINQTVNEQTQLSVTASATDQDLPAQTMTYSLDSAPAGMTINPASGQITWTPTEAQGPGNYNVAVRVTDNGTPALGHTNSFAVTVNEVNVAPQLVLPGAQAVNEQVELVFTINGTDADLPANALTYEMLSSPAGGTFNPATREFRWTPTEAEGPGNFTATFRVTDNNPDAVNAQQLSTTNSVGITVNEVNLAPQLTVPGLQTVDEQVELVFTINGSDVDLPANVLTYALLSGPTGATFNPATREFRWTPTEVQGPTNITATFRVTDNSPNAVNAQQLSTTNSVAITVNELNQPPVLTVPGPQAVTEENLLSVSASATDPDVPANPLTYTLISPPSGMTINANNGAISWTPNETQGSNSYTITVVATDTNATALNPKSFSVTNAFTITVNESNRPPVLTVPGNQTISELVLYSNNATATDPDLAANALAFALVSGPTGMVVTATGGITWTPSEFQGPGVHPVQIKVTDTNPLAINATSLSVTSSFTLTVSEVNLAPVVGTLLDQAGDAGQTVSFTATATDADLPANTFAFSLINPPAGASIVPGSGLFTWRLPASLANTTNTLAVRVTDNGSPNLSGTNTFTVTVNPLLPVVLTPLSYSNGQFRLSVTGSLGPDYVLEGGGSLDSLTNLATNTPVTMPFTFTNASAGSNQFYRVRLSP